MTLPQVAVLFGLSEGRAKAALKAAHVRFTTTQPGVGRPTRQYDRAAVRALAVRRIEARQADVDALRGAFVAEFPGEEVR